MLTFNIRNLLFAAFIAFIPMHLFSTPEIAQRLNNFRIAKAGLAAGGTILAAAIYTSGFNAFCARIVPLAMDQGLASERIATKLNFLESHLSGTYPYPFHGMYLSGRVLSGASLIAAPILAVTCLSQLYQFKKEHDAAKLISKETEQAAIVLNQAPSKDQPTPEQSVSQPMAAPTKLSSRLFSSINNNKKTIAIAGAAAVAGYSFGYHRGWNSCFKDSLEGHLQMLLDSVKDIRKDLK